MDEAKQAAGLAFEFVKPGGSFRVAVPDGNHPDGDYVEQVKPGGTGPGADDHKILYDIDSLTALFRAAGFIVEPLEFFDGNGRFHAVDWSDDRGRVIRSRRYDHRNTPEKLVYTSLIIDAVRPAVGGEK